MRAGGIHARHQHLQVLDVAHTGILQLLRGQGVDHDRHVLQFFLALLGHHLDGVQRLGLFLFGGGATVLRAGLRAILRMDRRAQGPKYGECKHSPSKLLVRHASPPSALTISCRGLVSGPMTC